MAKRRFRSRGRFSRVRRRRGGGAKRLKRFVKRVVNRMSEVKYATESGAWNYDANGTVLTSINPVITQGASKNQRIGNKIKSKRLYLKLNAWISSDTGAADWFTRKLRIVILQPRVAFSVPLQNSDILDDGNNWLSTIKGTAVRVLYDKMFPLTPQLDANQHPSNSGSVTKKMVFRINNNVTYRDSTVNSPTDLKDQYWIFMFSDFLGLGTGGYDIQGNWFVRHSYIDL